MWEEKCLNVVSVSHHARIHQTTPATTTTTTTTTTTFACLRGQRVMLVIVLKAAVKVVVKVVKVKLVAHGTCCLESCGAEGHKRALLKAQVAAGCHGAHLLVDG